MSTARPSFQTWFTTFVAVTGVLSLLPYRERALLPAPSGTEQGLLAQEIGAEGSDNLVNDTITGPTQRLARATLGGPGARRLISSIARPDGVPGTTGVASVVSSLLPPAGGTGGAGTGDGVNPDGGVNLAGGAGGGLPGPTGLGVNGPNGPNAPQGPTVLAGAASELLAAVVPEPSTWMLFIAGLMVVGQSLRTGRRREISLQA